MFHKTSNPGFTTCWRHLRLYTLRFTTIMLPPPQKKKIDKDWHIAYTIYTAIDILHKKKTYSLGLYTAQRWQLCLKRKWWSSRMFTTNRTWTLKIQNQNHINFVYNISYHSTPAHFDRPVAVNAILLT